MLARKTSLSTVSGIRDALCQVTMVPLQLRSLMERDLGAGTHRYFFDRQLSTGKATSCSFHPLRESVLSDILSKEIVIAHTMIYKSFMIYKCVLLSNTNNSNTVATWDLVGGSVNYDSLVWTHWAPFTTNPTFEC